jgi:hypothetical protein
MRRNYILSPEAIERYNTYAAQNSLRLLPTKPVHKQVYSLYLSDEAIAFLKRQATIFKTLNQNGDPSPAHYIELLAEIDAETDHTYYNPIANTIAHTTNADADA